MKPTDLRGILQYIPRFREKIFIIAIDGAIVTDENFANILLDIAVLRSLNIRVVLVHGAAAQIAVLARPVVAGREVGRARRPSAARVAQLERAVADPAGARGVHGSGQPI